MDTNFGQWLIEQMNAKEWSQAELSRVSGLTRQAIANYVGGRIPDNDATERLAHAFKIPVETVYRASGKLPPNQSDPWVDEVAYKLTLLSPGSRDIAKRFIDSILESEEAARQKERKARKNNPSHAAK